MAAQHNNPDRLELDNDNVLKAKNIEVKHIDKQQHKC